MKITVVGIGYVGLSNAVLLSQDNEVVLLDVIPEKVDMVNNKISPIKDKEIEEYLVDKDLNLKATLNIEEAYKGAKYVFIAAPTNYDDDAKKFDTSILESVIQDVKRINPEAVMVIKSTIPVRFTEMVKEKYNSTNIVFSPEFLREGKALYDLLYPSRIVIGEKSERANEIAELMQKSAIRKGIPVLYTGSTEAESIKLFSNTYLAMRVAYFNELDTYAELNDLNSSEILQGVGLDTRIGDHYNNPSFGYGGYCLPKDTKQMQTNYEGIPNKLMGAIVESNAVRKEHIAEMIIQMEPETVGVYTLAMKSGSDNFREAAIIDVIMRIQGSVSNIIIYEPLLNATEFMGCRVEKSLDKFKEVSDVILSNRMDPNLADVKHKVYTRDIFNRD